MAIYKVIYTSPHGSEYLVRGYGYTTVPAGNNQAGVPWQTVVAAMRQADNFRQNIAPPTGVTAVSLTNGSVHEWRWQATIPQAATPAQAVTAIQAAVDAQEAAMIAEMQTRLRYWGFEGDTG